MEQEQIYRLLCQVRSGAVSPDEAAGRLAREMEPEMQVGNYADIDLHREQRQGMPEVIYGEGKSVEQIAGIAAAMKEKDIPNIMITRLSQEKAEQLQSYE